MWCVLGGTCVGMYVLGYVYVYVQVCVLGVLQNGPWQVLAWVVMVVMACGSMTKAPKYRNAGTRLRMFPQSD